MTILGQILQQYEGRQMGLKIANTVKCLHFVSTLFSRKFANLRDLQKLSAHENSTLHFCHKFTKIKCS